MMKSPIYELKEPEWITKFVIGDQEVCYISKHFHKFINVSFIEFYEVVNSLSENLL